MIKFIKFYWSLVLMVVSLIGSMILAQDADVRVSLSVLILIIFGFCFFIQWYILKRKNIRLEKANLEAELSLLKNQLDPHFYFNTLNNLYGLAKRKSDKTPEVIMKLSEIMRYVIYQGKEDKVTIDQEVSYLENYLELQALRMNKAVDVVFEKDISNIHAEIAPLLLIVPLENAYKHGVDTLTENAYIHILLEESNEVLKFEIENNFSRESRDEDSGIGLNNLKKRLDLIYGERYEMVTFSEEDLYYLNLRIQL